MWYSQGMNPSLSVLLVGHTFDGQIAFNGSYLSPLNTTLVDLKVAVGNWVVSKSQRPEYVH